MQAFAIVGAGFSGTMTTVHLLRLHRGAQITLIERSGRFPAGVAYFAAKKSHLLNVPAGQMSAFPDDPGHFARWADVSGATFAPRAVYGAYLSAILAEAEARAPMRLRRIAASASSVRLEDDGACVELQDADPVQADHVVLALGNFRPQTPPVAGGWSQTSRYVRDPWEPSALDFEAKGDVLLLGTGLTMIDIAVALKERGHRGTIHAVSRRGLMPQPHRLLPRAPSPRPAPTDLAAWPRTASGLLRALRKEVRGAERSGADWREVVTSLRHATPALWQSLPSDERRRFLRHLRPYWETHRHRASPDTSAAVEGLLERRELNVYAGRVLSYAEDTNALKVTLRDRRAHAERELRVTHVINCTGPDTDLRRVDDPFVERLLADGLVRGDGLGLGLDSDGYGAIVDGAGRVSERLSLVGPLRKGRLWENTAVPELRHEARALAERLAAGG
jgi:uncharacterized NAD(P)/FAD-binding protein YdhS